MAWTTPGTATAGSVLTAAFWNEQVRDNELMLAPFFSAWTVWTPTLSGGFATGNATHTSRYLQVGKFVSFWTNILTGTTTTYGSTLRVSLPVACVAGDALMGVNAWVTVAGNSYFSAVAAGLSTSNCEIISLNVAGTYPQFATTTALIPATWATGARIRVGGVYEAA